MFFRQQIRNYIKKIFTIYNNTRKFNKDVQDFYTENSKMLLKQNKEDQNKWRHKIYTD